MSYTTLPLSLDILSFWFSPEVQPFWFVKDKEFDSALNQRFLNDYQVLSEKFSVDFLKTITDCKRALSCVLILDQSPRNIFRDTPQAFATDAQALTIARDAIHKGFDQALSSPTHRNFLYMPFMHSEELDNQEESIRLFSSIPGNDLTVGYAKQHRDIIAKFGRFPHRNKILARLSSPEEVKFLEDFKGF